MARRYNTVKAPREQLHEIAIGCADGRAVFQQPNGGTELPEGWDLSGSIHAPTGHFEAHPWISFDTTIEVPLRSLDSWAEEAGIGTVDFIWADVQGAEGALIEGGRETLARTHFFYTEYHDTELYEGQWTLDQIAEALPHHALHHRWEGDALFALRSERRALKH